MNAALSKEHLLATLLQLEKRARACTTVQALAYLMVNDTHALTPYRQAALWTPGAGGDGTVTALSGLAVPDANAPYTAWLAHLLARRAKDGATGAFQPQAEEREMWAEHLPAYGLLLRLPLDEAGQGAGGDATKPAGAKQVGATHIGATQAEATDAGATHIGATHAEATRAGASQVGAIRAEPTRAGASNIGATHASAQRADGRPSHALLVLWRDTPWQGADIAVLALLADAYAHAWRALMPARRGRRGASLWTRLRHGEGRATWGWALALAVVALMFVPVRQSVLAPAEVVARAPTAVRAPMQGVVDRIAVAPNQPVEKGQLLAALDVRDLEGRLESARQTLAVADAELRQNQQLALVDDRSKATLALALAKREQAASDVDFYTRAVTRAQLRAERGGIALFDDPADWIGKPVALGERIMMVADPADVELEIHLPVGDAIKLPEHAAVQLFLNTAPASPLPATLVRVGYRAAPTAEGVMAYRVRARFDVDGGVTAVSTAGTGGTATTPGTVDSATSSSLPRVGLKGTAKLYGERTTLFGYLLRKPLATVRVWLGM